MPTHCLWRTLYLVTSFAQDRVWCVWCPIFRDPRRKARAFTHTHTQRLNNGHSKIADRKGAISGFVWIIIRRFVWMRLLAARERVCVWVWVCVMALHLTFIRQSDDRTVIACLRGFYRLIAGAIKTRGYARGIYFVVVKCVQQNKRYRHRENHAFFGKQIKRKWIAKKMHTMLSWKF